MKKKKFENQPYRWQCQRLINNWTAGIASGMAAYKLMGRVAEIFKFISKFSSSLSSILPIFSLEGATFTCKSLTFILFNFEM